MSTIAENLAHVHAKMRAACVQAGRGEKSVKLVAVSKTKPVEFIQEALAAGQTIFGENYVQEAIDKIKSLPGVDWHFVGSLQSNKAKQVAGSFALVHSVDRLKLAQSLNLAAEQRGVVQKILLQIHIGDEATKHGFSLAEAGDAIAEISALQNLSVCGLMSLPPLEETEAKARKNFSVLQKSLDVWRLHLKPEAREVFCELSMGTSSDYQWAILEGATLVRVGTDIFGARV